MLDPQAMVESHLVYTDGKALIVDGETGLGVMKITNEVLADGESTQRQASILGPFSLLSSVKYGDEINFDGSTYQVESDPFPSPDLGFCRVVVHGPILVSPEPIIELILTTTAGVSLTTTTGIPLLVL